MDALIAALITGGVASTLWALKIIGEKLIKKYFDDAEKLENMKDDMLNTKINRINSDMTVLSSALKSNSEEHLRSKIMMQGLTHELAGLRAEIAKEGSSSKKSLESLGKVLVYINQQLKKQGAEIESLGKIIIKDWPEGK